VPTLFSVVGLMSGFVLNFDPFLIRRGSLVFPNSEDFGAAYRTNTLRGRASVLQGHLLWTLYLLLASAFETVSLHDAPLKLDF